MVTDHSAAAVTLPPMSAQRCRRARSAMPRATPRASRSGVPRGTPSAQRNQRGRAPAAARSERFTASAFQPTSSGVKRSQLKCTRSTTASVVATSFIPRAGRTAAQSLPGPMTTRSPRGKGARNASISSSSEGNHA
jgi:hypothetical protein